MNYSDNNDIFITGNKNDGNKNDGNYNDKNKNYNKSKHKYVKVLVCDTFNNRDIILKVTKKQRGIYVWESLGGNLMYVDHYINLYNRISSYFMPSMLNTKALESYVI